MLPVVLKREEPEVDEAVLIPLYRLVEDGFYPEMVAWATRTSAEPEALRRTLIRPDEYFKLKEYLKHFQSWHAVDP